VLPPGTILQLLYLKERLRGLSAGRFLEVGVGAGLISRVLLARGWTGVGYDLGDAALEQARENNEAAVAGGRYTLRHADWLRAPDDAPVDLVISAMVLEHLADNDEEAYFRKAERQLRAGGRAIFFVPASPDAWGVEDEVAGHVRRYTAEGFRRRAEELGWRCDHLAGLTFPLSNLLLPLSNALVSRQERAALALAPGERTVRSGDRHVTLKTAYPPPFRLILNEAVLYPFHLMQKAFRSSSRALILYAECLPAR
jgi:SAM-dependent methyltransferase